MGTIINLILYLLAGYWELADLAGRRTQNRRSLPAIFLVLAILYAVVSAILLGMLGLPEDSVGCLENVMLLFAALNLFGIVYDALHGGFTGKLPWKIAFLAYFALILAGTVFGRDGLRNNTEVYLTQPLRFLTLSDGERGYFFRHFMLNIALFLPLGFFFPGGFRGGKARALDAIAIGCAFSTAIETVQLVAAIGQCDIDDVIANTLGFAAGLLLWRLVFGKEPESQGRKEEAA